MFGFISVKRHKECIKRMDERLEWTQDLRMRNHKDAEEWQERAEKAEEELNRAKDSVGEMADRHIDQIRTLLEDLEQFREAWSCAEKWPWEYKK